MLSMQFVKFFQYFDKILWIIRICTIRFLLFMIICLRLLIVYRGVSRIFIIGFPASGLGRYFNRGGEATSDTQLNPGYLNSVCVAHIHEGSSKHNSIYKIKFKVHPYLFYIFLTNFILLFMQLILYCMPNISSTHTI